MFASVFFFFFFSFSRDRGRVADFLTLSNPYLGNRFHFHFDVDILNIVSGPFGTIFLKY